MTTTERRAIAWLRRDLRLADNRSLAAATRDADRAWPVFVADPDLLREHDGAPARTAWFGATLRALDARLRAVGSGLTVLSGRPEEVLPAFAAEIGAEAVYAARDEDPRGVARDRRVGEALPLRPVDDGRIVAPDGLRTAAGEAYTVFTPFRRALAQRLADDPSALVVAQLSTDRLAPPPSPERRPDALSTHYAAHPLPDAGEDAAGERLAEFVEDAIAGYRDDRDRPDRDGTSRLSPYLRVGAISVRALWRAAADAEAGAVERGDRHTARGIASWRGELAWREFFAHVLSAHPRLARESFRTEYDGIEWVAGDEADALLAAWREGRTGFPFVDAGMRQLAATGWMHNRARLVTASFLVKDAGVDWRRGASIFSERLLDADVQQNDGNWQWVAGVGTDAAPYFRIFNPVLQSKKFDPHGTYLRRWLPELAEVPDQDVHEPWGAPRPPAGYPDPILDHAHARERALARYRAARGG